jgi:nucleotide-binding universal stress UspA family protein
MFGRIVVGYDDSPAARRALDTALELAQLAGSEVIAVAIEAHLPHYGATVGEVDEERIVEEQDCTRWLKAAQATADERTVPLRTEIRAGHPAQELVRAAEAHGADLLVVGRSGHSKVWGRLMGTTADKATRHVHCAVLVVN